MGRGRRGDEPAPDPRELPAAEPQSSQAARAAAAASSRLSVSFTSRPTDSGAGAEKQADHRQPPDLPTPESAAQPDSPRWLRAPKIQRSQTSTGCAAGRGGSRGAPGRAHPQLTALTTRTLPRIKHAVEPNLAAGLGSGGQRLGDGLAEQAPGQERSRPGEVNAHSPPMAHRPEISTYCPLRWPSTPVQVMPVQAWSWSRRSVAFVQASPRASSRTYISTRQGNSASRTATAEW